MVNFDVLLKEAINSHQAGNLSSAESLYRRVLEFNNENLDALYLLGTLSFQQKDYETAVELLKKAALIDSNHPDIYNNLGLACYELGKFDESVRFYEKGLILEPGFPECHNNLGLALSKLGRKEEAVDSFKRAIELKPDYIDAYSNQGYTLMETGKMAEAVTAFENAIKLNPDYLESHFNLGVTFYKQGRYDDAIKSYRNALQIKPGYAEAFNNLGVVLKAKGMVDDAISSFKSAVHINPEHVDAHYNLGNMLWGSGRHNEAIGCYDRALKFDTDHIEARWNRALLLLMTGNYEQGWQDYEVRFARKTPPERLFAQPRWDGSDLSGRRILVYSEQGFGDTFQFVRLLPMVKARGGKVIFECQKELSSVLSLCDGIDEIIDQNDSGKPDISFDTHIPLLSLPGVLGVRLENLPSKVPYVFVNAELIDKWRERLRVHKGYKVGIVWGGNPDYRYNSGRSCDLKTFGLVGQLPGTTLFSLQKGGSELAAVNQPDEFSIANLNAEPNNFSDTAALIMNLDLVISVDTAVVHLAGALGKPVWLILVHASDWRYLLKRTDSPWYPTMRIFRCPKSGDRTVVMRQMVEELRGILENG